MLLSLALCKIGSKLKSCSVQPLLCRRDSAKQDPFSYKELQRKFREPNKTLMSAIEPVSHPGSNHTDPADVVDSSQHRNVPLRVCATYSNQQIVQGRQELPRKILSGQSMCNMGTCTLNPKP